MENRTSRLLPVLVAGFFLAAILAAYIAGYLLLGEAEVHYSPSVPRPVFMWRIYPNGWLATAFQPAAKVESTIRDIRIYTLDGGARRGVDFDFTIGE
jgi:hypothetical protein